MRCSCGFDPNTRYSEQCQDGCIEWPELIRVYLCEHQTVDHEAKTEYCDAAMDSGILDCGKAPRIPEVGYFWVTYPCDSCKGSGEWVELDDATWVKVAPEA